MKWACHRFQINIMGEYDTVWCVICQNWTINRKYGFFNKETERCGIVVRFLVAAVRVLTTWGFLYSFSFIFSYARILRELTVDEPSRQGRNTSTKTRGAGIKISKQKYINKFYSYEIMAYQIFKTKKTI